MTTESDAHIEITGEIGSAEDLECLVEAIVNDRPTTDWSGDVVRDADVARDLVLECLQNGSSLTFAENERGDCGTFERIEAACRKIGLCYMRTTSANEEFDTPGNREVWHPGMTEPACHDGVDDGAEALVKAGPLLDLLKDRKYKEATAFLERAMDPTAGMPKGMSSAPGVIPVVATGM